MNFEIRFGYDEKWLDEALKVYNSTELKRPDRAIVHEAFRHSFAVVTCWQNGQLVGVGRMISDGVMYANIYDLVVHPQFQKKGCGKMLMESLVSKVPSACIHLTSTFGNEDFYKRLGFRQHKTAMAKYPSRLSSSTYLEV